MANDSFLWNPDAKRVWAAGAATFGGSALLAAAYRALAAQRDNSLAFGDIESKLQNIVADDDYLSANNDITLPRHKRPTTPITIDRQEVKQAGMWEDIQSIFSKGVDRTTREAKDLFTPWSITTGPNYDTAPGTDPIGQIPLSWGVVPVAAFAGLRLGTNYTDKAIKQRAKNRMSEEQRKAKQEFESALVYEQEEAAKRRKQASEQSELIQAIDDYYSAAARYEALVKVAKAQPPDPKDLTVARMGWGISAALASLLGYNSLTKAYSNERKRVENEEKEKLLGLGQNYEDLYRDLSAPHIATQPLQISSRKSPGITDKLVNFK